MRLPVLIHLLNEDPVAGDLDEMPEPGSSFVTVRNPRQRDGRPVAFLDRNVDTVLFAWSQIVFIQLLPQADLDNLYGFVRE